MPRLNPWTLVPAADYEAHMGPEGADQLRPLAAIFRKAWEALRPAQLLVLGVGTGNGLECVDPAVTQRVVGVDVNIQYLAVARQRHMRLGPRLELFCADVEKVELPEAAFGLVFAGLLFEWVDARVVADRVARWLAPGGSLVAVLELAGEGGKAPASRFRSVQEVSSWMRLVPPEELGAELERAGLAFRQQFVVPVAHGSRLHVGRWVRPK